MADIRPPPRAASAAEGTMGLSATRQGGNRSRGPEGSESRDYTRKSSSRDRHGQRHRLHNNTPLQPPPPLAMAFQSGILTPSPSTSSSASTSLNYAGPTPLVPSLHSPTSKLQLRQSQAHVPSPHLPASAVSTTGVKNCPYIIPPTSTLLLKSQSPPQHPLSLEARAGSAPPPRTGDAFPHVLALKDRANSAGSTKQKPQSKRSTEGVPVVQVRRPSTAPASAAPLCTSPTSIECLDPVNNNDPLYDFYGFKRAQPYHVRPHIQLAFETKYRAVCDTRAAKWDAWLAKTNGQFPSFRTEKAKRYIRKGIPDHLRAAVWFNMSGAEAQWKEETGLYTHLICREEQDLAQGYTKENNPILEHIAVMDRDIYRTFPDNIKFRPRQYHQVFKRREQEREKLERERRVGGVSRPEMTTSSTTLSDTFNPYVTPPRDQNLGFEDADEFDIADTPTGGLNFDSNDNPELARSDSYNTSKDSDPPVGDMGDQLDLDSFEFVEHSEAERPPNSQNNIVNELNPYLLSLRRILMGFAYYSWPHPDKSRSMLRTCTYPIGYCQSLNFITAFLLLVFSRRNNGLDSDDFESGCERARLAVEERVFWMLIVVVEDLLPKEMYGATLEGCRSTQDVLWTWMVGKQAKKFGLERIARWAEGYESATAAPNSMLSANNTGRPRQGGINRLQTKRSAFFDRKTKASTSAQPSEPSAAPPLSLISTHWFLTLFVTVLPTHTLLRTWDVFVHQGEKSLVRLTLTLLKLHQDRLTRLNLQDPTRAWRWFKACPGGEYNPHKLFFETFFLSRSRVKSISSRVKRSTSGGVGVACETYEPATHHESDEEEEGEDVEDTRAGRGELKSGVGSVSRKMIEKYRELAQSGV
ncbi:hypothetical protein DFS34DRAFT_618102 [Phlyctochytrium arcticum]|nr:hypothetical protein DFS34DRAFT_618102 [Phlyctochytrium arcticum]